jgi:hypothetical protein
MSLCMYCGVEVEEDVRSCPLCQNPLRPETEGGQPEPTRLAPIPQKVSRRMRRWLLEAISLLTATGAIVVVAVNLAFGMSLTWGRYPLAAIGFLWLATVLLLPSRRSVWASLVAEVAAASLFLFVLDWLTPGASWFLPLALPLTLLAGTILALTLVVVRRLDLSAFAIIGTAMLAAALFLLGLELFLNRHLVGRWFVSWSAATFTCTLPLVLLLFYLERRFKPMRAEIRKFLHL